MPPQKKSSVAKWKEKQKLERLEAKVKGKREEQRAMKALLEAEMDEESRQDNLGADEKEQELESKKKKEARLKEATEMLKRHNAREANREKVLRLGQIVENLLMVASGYSVKETTILFDAERVRKETFKEVEHVALERRNQALEILWAVSFKGDDFKRKIVGHGALDILSKVMEEFKDVSAKPEKQLEREIYKSALTCISSLAMNPENAPAMTRMKMTEYCVDLLSQPKYTFMWAIALDLLNNLSLASKAERKRMQGDLQVIQRIVGSKRTESWDKNAHVGYLQNGTEACTQAALSLVENLLTREEVRISLMQDTRASVLFRNILDLENVETKACLCRIINRLCSTQWCREQLKVMGLQHLICDAFISATNGYAQAATGVALAALVSSTDERTARLAGPFAINLVAGATKQDLAKVDFRMMTMPAILHVLRSLSRQKFVADMIVEKRMLSQLINMLRDQDASPISIEHATFIIGSVALQPKWNDLIRNFQDTLPALMEAMKNGEEPGARAGAARALQYLTSQNDVEFLAKISDFKHVSMDRTGGAIGDIWTGMGAIMKLVQKGMPQSSWEHGAGLLRNMTALEEIREKTMLAPGDPGSAVSRLTAIIAEGNVMAKMHAAAALGNICNKNDRKSAIIGIAGRVLMSMLKIDKVDPDVPPGELEFLDDMRECACTTLGTCATYDGHMDKLLELNFVARLGPLLSIKHKPLKFSAARGLRNLSATALGSEAICKDASCISSLEKAMRNFEEEDFIVEISACVSNCSLISDNLFSLLTPRMCKYMVMILKKGCNPARIHICKAVKAVGNSMSGYFQGQLCDAGVIPALVGLLEVDVTAPGSVAGAAAGAIARLVATDENVGARIVELAGLGMLVYLLRDGDAGSRAQACKCLWMICQNESYKLMLLQFGGMDIARAALAKQESDAPLARQILDIITNMEFEAGEKSLVERKKKERTAVRDAAANHYWEMEELRQQQRDMYDASPAHFSILSPITPARVSVRVNAPGTTMHGGMSTAYPGSSLYGGTSTINNTTYGDRLGGHSIATFGADSATYPDSPPRTAGSAKRVTFSREAKRNSGPRTHDGGARKGSDGHAVLRKAAGRRALFPDV